MSRERHAPIREEILRFGNGTLTVTLPFSVPLLRVKTDVRVRDMTNDATMTISDVIRRSSNRLTEATAEFEARVKREVQAAASEINTVVNKN